MGYSENIYPHLLRSCCLAISVVNLLFFIVVAPQLAYKPQYIEQTYCLLFEA
jgi:hypothetical protein